MARRRQRRRDSTGLAALLLTAFGYILFRHAWVAFILVILLSILVWVSFFVRTSCDVENKTDGEPCGNPVRGRLRACSWHRRQKRDALWAVLGMANPAIRYRIMFARSTGYGRTTPTMPGGPSPTVTRPTYDCVMLVSTVAAAAAAIVALAVRLT
jgi:hypothetical protein